MAKHVYCDQCGKLMYEGVEGVECLPGKWDVAFAGRTFADLCSEKCQKAYLLGRCWNIYEEAGVMVVTPLETR